MAERTSGKAYENAERLIIKGRMLQVGDILPEPFNVAPGVKILSVVNMHNTEVCDIQTAKMEAIYREHPEITVVSVSKQAPHVLAEVSREQGLTHPLISIDENTAEAIGVGLEPDEGASEEWRGMLLRAMVVVDASNRVVYVEYVMDQMQEPNYETALKAAAAAALHK